MLVDIRGFSDVAKRIKSQDTSAKEAKHLFQCWMLFYKIVPKANN